MDEPKFIPVPDKAAEIIEQRTASLNFFNDAYYGELAEVYQTIKARVSPIMVTNDEGKEVEDTSRTNICFPDHYSMVRRGVARMTRNTPNLRFRGGKDATSREKASALHMLQWDRSGGQRQFRKVVHSARAFGWGVAKNYYDKEEIVRNYRRRTEQLTREEAMTLDGAPPEDIAAAVQDIGPQLELSEIAQAFAMHGAIVTVPTTLTKYEGPMMKGLFIGDIFVEPGFRSINESAFVIENSFQDEDWLKRMSKLTTVNPETGEESLVLDPAKVKDLESKLGDSSYTKPKDMSLRRRMREMVQMVDPDFSATKPKTNKKRFMLDERHTIVNGIPCIDFVAQESIHLGRNWFPFDTYGKHLFTELILIPDLIEGIGDSGPRITRYIMQLRNARGNQTTDFVNNSLLPLFLGREGALDNQKLQYARTEWGRVLISKDPSAIINGPNPNFPSEAWQDQAQLVREMQQAAPEIADFASGTEAVPQAGKLATGLMMQQKASDSITADELQQVSYFLHDTLELHLAMNQQALQDKINIPRGANPRIDAMMDEGQPEMVIDPIDDLQQDFEPEPEAGSILAEDDDFHRSGAEKLFILASQNPDVLDKRKCAEKLVQTIPGIRSAEVMAPPPQPPPPEPPRISISITIKWPEIPSDVQMALLSQASLPTEETKMKSILEAPKHVLESANAVTELSRPADERPEEHPKSDIGAASNP